MSMTSPPATSAPADSASFVQSLNQSALPPPTPSTTSRHSAVPHPLLRASSKNRLSVVGSIASRSRPHSHIFPLFPSSLPFTQVRDFAYPIVHPLHYGPLPEPSEYPTLSDPPVAWEQKMPWDSWMADGVSRGHDLPPIQFGDGPPYSEDEDLQSPVVSTRHRKHKSTSTLSAGRERTGRGDDRSQARIITSSNFDDERGYYVGISGNGSERYYVNHGGEANGPGGELVTYPPDQARHSSAYHSRQQQPNDVIGRRSGSDKSSCPSSPGGLEEDQSRYSRDYQFTITSPDEEFHGKAVALFDFERENENELPLVEGQIIWVSYRHGQGWLVAEDPKTQESGLVPEAYVRLLRDIEGGMYSLTGQFGEAAGSPNDADTPTQPEPTGQYGHSPTPSSSTNGYHQPVVSTFSTSSKDLNPYPTEQLGIQAGQAPPQVVHYHGQRGGSQMSTPTVSQLQESGELKESQDVRDTGLSQAEPAAEPNEAQLAAAAVDTDR